MFPITAACLLLMSTSPFLHSEVLDTTTTTAFEPGVSDLLHSMAFMGAFLGGDGRVLAMVSGSASRCRVASRDLVLAIWMVTMSEMVAVGVAERRDGRKSCCSLAYNIIVHVTSLFCDLSHASDVDLYPALGGARISDGPLPAAARAAASTVPSMTTLKHVTASSQASAFVDLRLAIALSAHTSHRRAHKGSAVIMRLLSLPAALSLLAFTSAFPASAPQQKPLPLLIWHGLGDTYDADGLRSTGKLAEEVHPGTYVYYIRVDDDSSSDRTATFFGNITTQIAQVCEQITSDPKLANPDGSGVRADALGFSQGGQFLRGLLERCDGLSVRSLVTFGSQHNGIAQFPTCSTYDYVCKGATALIKGNAWTDYVQNKVVPAQYYRTLNDTTAMPTQDYLNHSNFLADINNERRHKNEAYKAKIAAMENFVMYVFDKDVTVIPKESGWFAEMNTTSNVMTPLKARPMYKEDWLGLRALDEKGGLVFRTAPGAHMELSEKMLKETFGTYFGPEEKEEVVAQVEDAVKRVQDAATWRPWAGRLQQAFGIGKYL